MNKIAADIKNKMSKNIFNSKLEIVIEIVADRYNENNTYKLDTFLKKYLNIGGFEINFIKIYDCGNVYKLHIIVKNPLI